MFLVAHNLEEVELTCNRVIWMDRGKIVMQGDDVISIVDKYIDASGGIPVERDPVTRRRLHRRGRRRELARSAGRRAGWLLAALLTPACGAALVRDWSRQAQC